MSEVDSGDDARSEVAAMGAIASALEPLSAPARRRVLQWAASRFLEAGVLQVEGRPSQSPPAANARAPRSYESIVDLFAAAAPQSGPERALAVMYWHQVVAGQEDVDGATVNSELTQMGQRLANVTATMTALIQQQPALVIQTKKSGKAQQARKRYRLTAPGIARVDRQLTSGSPA